MKNIKEDSMIGGMPANNVAGGAIAGLGVENPVTKGQAEPGVKKKKKKEIVPFNIFRRK